jgi:hypothetical protein
VLILKKISFPSMTFTIEEAFLIKIHKNLALIFLLTYTLGGFEPGSSPLDLQ